MIPHKHWPYLPTRGSAPGRTTGLALAVAVLFAANVLLGSYTVTIPDFVRILGAHLTGGEKIPGASFIVMEHKLPRAVVGTLVGAAFGLSGALFQTMLRNPLASPDVIGISYGASAAAVTAIVVFGASGAAVSGAAFAGALGVAVLIYAISRSGSLGSGGRRGDAAGSRLILAGVGIAAALHAMVSFLMTRADIRTAADVLIWLNGSLNSANWDRAGVLGLALIVLVPGVGLLAGPLRILELGDDTAAGLGVRVGAVRLAVVIGRRRTRGSGHCGRRAGGVRRLPRRPNRAPVRPHGEPAGLGPGRGADRPGRRLLRHQYRTAAAGRHRPASRGGDRCPGCPVPALAARHLQPKGRLRWQLFRPPA